MGRAGWDGWVHFADNRGTDPKHPHKCRCCGKVMPDDAVVARKHLAFHCPSFAESEVLACEAYILSFVGTKTKLTQQEESATNTFLKRRAKRPREEGAEHEEGKVEGAASTLPVSENVLLHGLAGAKLRLLTTGDAGILQHFQKFSPAAIQVANDLLFRFLVVNNLALSVFDCKEWRDFLGVAAPALLPQCINYGRICNGDYITRMFVSVRDAVEEVLGDSSCLTTLADGWTDATGTALVNIAEMTEYSSCFWHDQVTPRGSRHTAEFYESVCDKSIKRANNRAFISDNPTTMTALKSTLVRKYKGVEYKVGLPCNFHVVDLIAGDGLGLTGAHTADYAVDELANPKTGLVALAKSIVIFFKNSQAPLDAFALAREEKNAVISSQNRGKDRAEHAPCRPTLKLAGATRKTSNCTMLVSVGSNVDVLQTAVNSVSVAQHILGLKKGKPTEPGPRDNAEKMRAAINEAGKLGVLLLHGEFLGLVQQAQRVIEMPGKNLCDVAFDFSELHRRISSFPIGLDAKDKLVRSIKYRFDNVVWSPAFACALAVDPRLGFKLSDTVGPGKLLDLSWSSMATDIVATARTWIEHTFQYDDMKDKLLEQFGDLMEGSVFPNSLPETAAQLRRANDMPAFRWCKLYGRTCRVADLFRLIVSPLVSLPSVADKVEHGNSTYKWVQTGRVTLKSETARKLVYIIMNLRALRDHRERVAAVYKPGQFKLGWGWRPTSRDTSCLLAIAEVDAEPNPLYAEAASRLAASVASLEAPPPNAAAPEPRRSPRLKQARTGDADGESGARRGAPVAAAPAVRQLKMITCWTCGFVFQERPPSPEDHDPTACGRGDALCKLPQPEPAQEPVEVEA